MDFEEEEVTEVTVDELSGDEEDLLRMKPVSCSYVTQVAKRSVTGAPLIREPSSTDRAMNTFANEDGVARQDSTVCDVVVVPDDVADEACPRRVMFVPNNFFLFFNHVTMSRSSCTDVEGFLSYCKKRTKHLVDDDITMLVKFLSVTPNKTHCDSMTPLVVSVIKTGEYQFRWSLFQDLLINLGLTHTQKQYVPHVYSDMLSLATAPCTWNWQFILTIARFSAHTWQISDVRRLVKLCCDLLFEIQLSSLLNDVAVLLRIGMLQLAKHGDSVQNAVSLVYAGHVSTLCCFEVINQLSLDPYLRDITIHYCCKLAYDLLNIPIVPTNPYIGQLTAHLNCFATSIDNHCSLTASRVIALLLAVENIAAKTEEVESRQLLVKSALEVHAKCSVRCAQNTWEETWLRFPLVRMSCLLTKKLYVVEKQRSSYTPLRLRREQPETELLLLDRSSPLPDAPSHVDHNSSHLDFSHSAMSMFSGAGVIPCGWCEGGSNYSSLTAASINCREVDSWLVSYIPCRSFLMSAPIYVSFEVRVSVELFRNLLWAMETTCQQSQLTSMTAFMRRALVCHPPCRPMMRQVYLEVLCSPRYNKFAMVPEDLPMFALFHKLTTLLTPPHKRRSASDACLNLSSTSNDNDKASSLQQTLSVLTCVMDIVEHDYTASSNSSTTPILHSLLDQVCEGNVIHSHVLNVIDCFFLLADELRTDVGRYISMLAGILQSPRQESSDAIPTDPFDIPPEVTGRGPLYPPGSNEVVTAFVDKLLIHDGSWISSQVIPGIPCDGFQSHVMQRLRKRYNRL